MKEKSETYRCRACGLVYKEFPGPTQCPKCGGLYIDWINFKQDWEYVNERWRRKDQLRDLVECCSQNMDCMFT